MGDTEALESAGYLALGGDFLLDIDKLLLELSSLMRSLRRNITVFILNIPIIFVPPTTRKSVPTQKF